MNRIALSIALALGLLAGPSTRSRAGEPSPSTGAGVALRPAAPSWFDRVAEGDFARLASDDGPSRAGGPIAAKGRRFATEPRALDDARAQLDRAVAEWLAPDVPGGWTPPAPLVDALVVGRHVEPVLVDLKTTLGLVADDPDLGLPDVLYVAALQADLAPGHREAMIHAYQSEVGARRIALLGGVGGFLLACLAILSLYIRADEATRGYYTNRLRLVAVASAGAAGAVIYRLVA